jgi:4-hydroxybenzoate polyprenyltransferase
MTSGNGQAPPKKPRPAPSKHPYRDSAIAYAILGAVVVAIAWLTGSGPARSLVGGVGAFVLATAYTWWRMRARERDRDRARQR